MSLTEQNLQVVFFLRNLCTHSFALGVLETFLCNSCKFGKINNSQIFQILVLEDCSEESATNEKQLWQKQTNRQKRCLATRLNDTRSVNQSESLLLHTVLLVSTKNRPKIRGPYC